MAQSSIFKNYQRTQRTMIIEEDYRGGMSYTDNALEDTSIKTMVNMNYKDDGLVITPRGGLNSVSVIPVSGADKEQTALATYSALNIDVVDNPFIKDYRAKAMIASNEQAGAIAQYSPDRKAVAYPVTDTQLVVQKLETNNFIASTLVDTFDEVKEPITPPPGAVDCTFVEMTLFESFQKHNWADIRTEGTSISHDQGHTIFGEAPSVGWYEPGVIYQTIKLTQGHKYFVNVGCSVYGRGGSIEAWLPDGFRRERAIDLCQIYTATATANFEVKFRASGVEDYGKICYCDIVDLTAALGEDHSGRTDTQLLEFARANLRFINGNKIIKVDGVTPPTPEQPQPEIIPQANMKLIGNGIDGNAFMHGYSLRDAKSFNPIHTIINNKAYYVVQDGTDTKTLQLSELTVKDKAGILTHRFKAIKPTELTPKEVVNSGYNMLLADPYTFKNTESAVYDIDGILPYSADEVQELLLTARQGQKIRFKVYYKYKKENDVTLRARWEWIDPNSGAIEWTPLQTQKDDNKADGGVPVSKNYTLGEDITLDFEPTVQQFQLRVSLYKRTGTTMAETPVKVMVMPLYKLATDTATTNKNLKPVKYNIATASGLTTWKQRVVAWGVTGAENILFTSEVNNPTYFPYPNNIDIFDENIKHVCEFQDGLLIFTSTKIYIATLLEDGIGFSTSLIQNRLTITDIDVRSIQVIKTMVYFKSDNYYYMIVPKVNSYRGELTLAPVSKPINNLLDNFDTSLREILETLYYKVYNNNNEYGINFLNYHNFVDGNAIRNVYTFATVFENKVINIAFVLNYDTMLRTWTSYVYQCNGRAIPFTHSVTDGTVLVDIADGVCQFIKFDSANIQDTFRLKNDAQRLLLNHQYLDTGYRKQGEQHKKRFREIQMKFNNTSKKKLTFYSEFILDGESRQTYYKYETKHITDASSEDYGLIYVERVTEPTMELDGQTMLSPTVVDDSCWSLDESYLPPKGVIKVRFPISGKGYTPRLKLLSFNEKQYELLNINWVSRAMNAR